MMVTLDDQLTGVLRPGVLCVEQVRVVAHDAAMDLPIMETERALRASGDSSAVVAAVRRLYHRTGVDPTKDTAVVGGAAAPASQRSGAAENQLALSTWPTGARSRRNCPTGLYDLDCVHGAVKVRLGRAGEQYAGIRKDTVHVDGRITLVDDDGPFGNPTSDSHARWFTVATSRALFVCSHRLNWATMWLSRALDLTAARALRSAGDARPRARSWARHEGCRHHRGRRGGERLGGAVPKQLLDLGGRTVLQRSVDAFISSGLVDEVVVVLPADVLTASRSNSTTSALRSRWWLVGRVDKTRWRAGSKPSRARPRSCSFTTLHGRW